ncbi:MAG: ABC transporter permease, partial [Atribacterota bacterium]|nr:ABC transporter permease [Atribacterota bacterium]
MTMKISFLQRHRNVVAIYGLLIGFIILSSFLSPQFRTSYNIFNLFRQAVAYGLLSIGQTIAILSAGIDLSVGSLVSLTACLTSGIMIGNPQLVIPLVLFILALGIGVGTANGLLITQLRVPPFISTLAMSAFLQGSVLLYTKKPVGGVTRGFMFFANGQIGVVPFALIFWVAIIIVFLFLLQKTSLGLHIYAVGGNKEVARLSGVSLFKTIMMVYILSLIHI